MSLFDFTKSDTTESPESDSLFDFSTPKTSTPTVDNTVEKVAPSLLQKIESAGGSILKGLFTNPLNMAVNAVQGLTSQKQKGPVLEAPIITGPKVEDLNKQADELTSLKSKLNLTDTKSVEDYNQKINDYQSRVNQYNTAQKAQEVLSKDYIPTPFTSPMKILSKDLSNVLNEPIHIAGEALGSTSAFQDLAKGSDAGQFIPSFIESLASRLQTGTEAISGLTGGLVQPDIQGAPDDIATKLFSTLSQGVGMAAGLGVLEGLNGLSAPKVILDNFQAYPKIQALFNGLAKSIPALAEYGQLNPNLEGIGDRLKTLGTDIATAIPYTALGLFSKKAVVVPASAALGFGMAKLSGASNKDAVISGTALGLLSLMGGKEESQKIVTQAQAKGQLYDEALKTINKFADTKLTSNSSIEDIKTAFKEAALKTHPDVGGDAKDFSSVTYARDILLGEGKSTESKLTNQKTPEDMKADIKKAAEEVKNPVVEETQPEVKSTIQEISRRFTPKMEEKNIVEAPENNPVTEEKGSIVSIARHGSTDSNGDKAFRGWEETSKNQLTPKGKEDAKLTGESIKKSIGNENHDDFIIVSSDLNRAVDSAKIASKISGVPVGKSYPELRSQDTGDFSGVKESEVKEKVKDMTENHPDQPLPGAKESHNDFIKRIKNALKPGGIIEKDNPGKKIIVVTHHQVEVMHANNFSKLTDAMYEKGIKPGNIRNVGMKQAEEKPVEIKKEEPSVSSEKSRAEELVKAKEEKTLLDMEPKDELSNRQTFFSDDIKIPVERAREIILENIEKAGYTEKDLKILYSSDRADFKPGEAAFFKRNKVLGDMIKLFEEDGKVGLITATHEAKHFLFSRMSPEMQVEALAAAKENLGPLYKTILELLYPKVGNYKGESREDALLQEYLVDEWARDDARKEGYKKSIFRKFFDFLDNIFIKIRDTFNNIKDYLKSIPAQEGGFIKNPLAEEENLNIEDRKKVEDLQRKIDDAENSIKTSYNISIEAGERKKDLLTPQLEKDKQDLRIIKTLSKKFPTFNTGNMFEDLKKVLKNVEEKNGVKEFKKAENIIEKVRSIPKAKIELPIELKVIQDQISGINEIIKEAEQRLEDHPGKKLQKFISKKEGVFEDFKNPDLATTESEKKDIQERNKKVMRAAMSALEGTEFSDEFDNPDTIREQIDSYQSQKERLNELKEQRKVLKDEFTKNRNEFFTKERDRIAINSMVAKEERLKTLEEVAKVLRKEGRQRKEKVNDIQEYFKLTDKEIKKLNFGNKDFRLMTDKEFEEFLKEVQGKAYEIKAHRDAVLEIENTIHEMELKKTENLREALKMRKLENMSLNELNKFNDLLQTFQHGDEFLGKRQIQTAALTDLGPIKTHREALKKLAEEANVPITDVKQVQPTWKDKFLGDVSLQKRNPLFKIMVQNANLETVAAGQRFNAIKEEFTPLLKEARDSRKISLFDRLAPTDELIYKFQEVSDAERIKLMEIMTPEEIEAALYVKQKFLEMRDFLLTQGALEKYVKNYITRMHRSFLEILKTEGKNLLTPEGFKGLLKELWDANKLQKINFQILEDKTGEVLPLEKFFKYSISRTGHLNPSKNVGRVFLEYVRVFEQKRQLDSFIPKLDIYTNILTPQVKTKGGLIMNDTLNTFVKQWLNNKKGRIMDVKIGSPGDPIDFAIRLAICFTRLKDLGLNIPVGLASNAGAQLAAYIPLGTKKYVTGIVRMNTKQGKSILEKYEPIVGEKFLKKLEDVSKTTGEKSSELLFSLFSGADRRAKSIFLLGLLSPTEFKNGEISNERLADIKLEIARYHVTDGMKSLIGRTSLGSAATQYKTWAIPLATSTFSNIKALKKIVQNSKEENPFKTKEVQELGRFIFVTALLLFVVYEEYNNLKNKKSRTFLENVAYKSMNDSLSMIGALDPSLWTKVRILQFADDLATATSNIIIALSTNADTTTGTKALSKALTPSIMNQLFGNGQEGNLKNDLKTKLKTAQTKLKDYDTDILEKVQNAYDEAKAAGFDTEKAQNIVDALSDNEYTVYKSIAAIGRAQDAIDLESKILPIVKKANDLGFDTKEADKYITEQFPDTPEGDREYDVYTSIKNSLYGEKGQKDTSTKEWDKQSFITHIANIAQAIGTDPVTAFGDIFGGNSSWRIVGVENGNIRVARMPTKTSEDIKKSEGGQSKEFKLDHSVPLEIFGNNSNENLQLISTEQWEINTPIENFLRKSFEDNKITGKQAREYIIRFKAGQKEPLSPSLQKEYKDKYNSQPLTFDEIKNII